MLGGGGLYSNDSLKFWNDSSVKTEGFPIVPWSLHKVIMLLSFFQVILQLLQNTSKRHMLLLTSLCREVRTRDCIYWPSVYGDIQQYFVSCLECQKTCHIQHSAAFTHYNHTIHCKKKSSSRFCYTVFWSFVTMLPTFLRPKPTTTNSPRHQFHIKYFRHPDHTLPSPNWQPCRKDQSDPQGGMVRELWSVV